MDKTIEKYVLVNLKDNTQIAKYLLSDFKSMSELRLDVLEKIDNLTYTYIGQRIFAHQFKELYSNLYTHIKAQKNHPEGFTYAMEEVPLYFLNLILAHFNLKLIALRKSTSLEDALAEYSQDKAAERSQNGYTV
jgi:hypothetical protein